jgi:hypothetical protein
MSKEQTIAILNKYGFREESETDDGYITMLSIGEIHDGISVVMLVLKPYPDGQYTVGIEGYFNLPVINNERELLWYLNRFHPGWNITPDWGGDEL